jgi:hypothetical protein
MPATFDATAFAPSPFALSPPPRPKTSKVAIVGGGAALLAVLGGGIFYVSSVSRQKDQLRERAVAQTQEAENKRQATLRQERLDKATEEEKQTARQLSERVKQEQASAASQAAAEEKTRVEEKARLEAAAAQKAARKVAVPNAVQKAVPEKSVVIPPPAAEVNVAAYQKVSGTWTGSYICPQGPTAARMVVNATPQGVTAMFAFAVPNSKPGTFQLRGQYSPANGQLVLSFVQWGVQPPNYGPANMTGIVDLNQGTFAGRFLAPGCTTFSLRHQ